MLLPRKFSTFRRRAKRSSSAVNQRRDSDNTRGLGILLPAIQSYYFVPVEWLQQAEIRGPGLW